MKYYPGISLHISQILERSSEKEDGSQPSEEGRITRIKARI